MNARAETYKHILNVQKFIFNVIRILLNRASTHDNSKLMPPEEEYFEKYTPLLSSVTYGSEEYKKYCKEMKPAIDHHQSVNFHHPEFFKNGIKDMTLIDLTEMLCDWKAASLRHKTGDIFRSIELNQKRFGYSDELKQIFINTIKIICP